MNTLSNDSKTINCYIFSIIEGVVSWKSKKHILLAQSTMQEVSWLRCLRADIPLWKELLPTMLIHYDSIVPVAKIKKRCWSYSLLEL